MSEQDETKVTTLQRPATDDFKAWNAYWTSQGQQWRTEPEIGIKRQEELTKRRLLVPNIEQGKYPFKDINPKLTRADVEWLLATHESGGECGPVNWNDEIEQTREGLDFRGVDLRGEDLSNLPLVQINGGRLTYEQGGLTDRVSFIPKEQQRMAAVLLQGANLSRTQLQGAGLRYAQLQEANLFEAQLQRSDLSCAQLQGAELFLTHLQGSALYNTQLQGAELYQTQLQGAYLWNTQLQGANLSYAELQGANLRHTQLQGTNLYRTNMEDTDLEEITLSDAKYGTACLADVKWDNVNLAMVDWELVKVLGDEQKAQQKKDHEGKTKKNTTMLAEYKVAVRANRQLAVVLRGQGLNEEADHFAYSAQRLQRIVLWKQRKYGRYLFSGVLNLLAGYGYLPLRSVFWYLVTLLGFALAYSTFGHLSLWPPDAFIYSLTSFHGRGFFPGLEGKHSLHDPLIMFAAFEAVVGLFIEISFIATFTQRFFGK